MTNGQSLKKSRSQWMLRSTI